MCYCGASSTLCPSPCPGSRYSSCGSHWCARARVRNWFRQGRDQTTRCLPAAFGFVGESILLRPMRLLILDLGKGLRSGALPRNFRKVSEAVAEGPLRVKATLRVRVRVRVRDRVRVRVRPRQQVGRESRGQLSAVRHVSTPCAGGLVVRCAMDNQYQTHGQAASALSLWTKVLRCSSSPCKPLHE